MSLNKAMLIGNAGQDPEVTQTDNGKVATFNLAVTEKYKDKNGERQERTDWIKIVAWRNSADIVEKFIKKGSPLFIEGKIRVRSWADKEGKKMYVTEVIADNIQLLGRKDAQPAQQSSQPAAPSYENNYGSTPMPLEDNGPADDDLPF